MFTKRLFLIGLCLMLSWVADAQELVSDGCWVDRETRWVPPEQFTRPPLLIDDEGYTNQLVVRLDLDDPDVYELITGVATGPQTRSQAEAGVVEAVNAGNPMAIEFFHGALQGWHLISERLGEVGRAALDDDSPEEILHQYIVLSYASVDAAMTSLAFLLNNAAVVSAGNDRAIPLILPPGPQSRGARSNGVHASPNATTLTADQPMRIYPEAPQAYESFGVEFLALENSWDLPHQSVVQTIVNGDVLIDYLVESHEGSVSDSSLHSRIQGLPPGVYTLRIRQRDSDGHLQQAYQMNLQIPDSPRTLQAQTLYHSESNRYVLTTCQTERLTMLEKGWAEADSGFNVWPAETRIFPPGSLPVCRFYAPQVDSFFYTVDEGECFSLQHPDNGWEFDGVVFWVFPPKNGACLSGTTSVWRLYNGRAVEQDSNHRFVASAETYRTMIADGWIGEGVAFCSPPVSEAD